MKYYTGIGSRETPISVLEAMYSIAQHLYKNEWTLRSGGAPGADQAFEWGVADEYEEDNGWPCHEIYLPWPTFQQNQRSWLMPKRTKPQDEAYEIAAQYHPAWNYLKPWGKTLHARNVHQALGYDVTNPEPSEFIVCWTKGAKGEGGTGQALRIAKAYNIKIYDLADEEQAKELVVKLDGSFVLIS